MAEHTPGSKRSRTGLDGWERMGPLDRTARALAFYVWQYEPPNGQAVVAAVDVIERVREAATAAGVRLVFEDLFTPETPGSGPPVPEVER